MPILPSEERSSTFARSMSSRRRSGTCRRKNAITRGNSVVIKQQATSVITTAIRNDGICFAVESRLLMGVVTHESLKLPLSRPESADLVVSAASAPATAAASAAAAAVSAPALLK